MGSEMFMLDAPRNTADGRARILNEDVVLSSHAPHYCSQGYSGVGSELLLYFNVIYRCTTTCKHLL